MNSRSENILVELGADGVALVTLDRPAKRNALSLAMWREIARLFAELGERKDIRAVILTGAGGHFSAGADISEFSAVRHDARSNVVYDDIVDAAVRSLRDCSKPTIAAIRGYAVGGGCGLALACDFRVADATAQMGIPAARLGIVYGVEDCSLLISQVGLVNAKRILYSGRHFSRDECLQLGLIDIGAEGAIDGARELAAEFLGSAPMTVSGTKLILNAIARGEARQHAAQIQSMIDRAADSDDYREGARAFLERRPPKFVGR